MILPLRVLPQPPHCIPREGALPYNRLRLSKFLSTSGSSSPAAALLSLYSPLKTSMGKVSSSCALEVSHRFLATYILDHLHLDTSGKFWINFNSLSIRVSGMIHVQDGKYCSNCSPHSVLCKPTTCQGHSIVSHPINFTGWTTSLPGQIRLNKSVNNLEM